MTEQELLAEWKPQVHAGATPVTQSIGVAAWEAGVEGLIVPSARLVGTTNLVVLVDRMRKGSSI